MSPKPPPNEETGRLIGKLYTIGTALTVPMVAGILVDWQMGWMPWATLAGTVIGFSACMVYLVTQANRP